MDTTDEVLLVARKHLHRIKKSGSNNIMAACPFHKKSDGSEEKTPSFAMSLTNGLFFCHACGEKGNLQKFLRLFGYDSARVQNEYAPLLEELSKNIAPPVDPLNPGVVHLDPLPSGLLGLFDYCPLKLVDQGFSEETLARFEIGFDRDHLRITYPLRDLSGQLVGISGRTVTGEHPRYKIYDAEYKTWDLAPRYNWNKRTILWNAHTVYPGLFFNPLGGEIVLVEGFNACMWVHQSGITDTVALLGTYMSQEQQWMLERMGATVYIFLDNNDAGLMGVDNIASKLVRSLPVKVMCYPPRLLNDETAQPDNLTSEEVLEAKSNAINYSEWHRLA